MLTRIRLTGDTGEVANLYYGGNSGYDLLDVEGLGPTPADISYSEFSTLDGGVFQSSRSRARNIVISAGFRPDYSSSNGSVAALRRHLYRVAGTKKDVRVDLFVDGVLDKRISGHVESHEPSIFTKEPEVQISIMCFEPHLLSTNKVIERTDGWEWALNYDGDEPTGFQTRIFFDVDLSWFELESLNFDPVRKLRVSGLAAELRAGRSVFIDTTPGKKRVTLRDSNANVIKTLFGETKVTGGWPELVPGENTLHVETNVGYVFRYTVEYNEKYSGI